MGSESDGHCGYHGAALRVARTEGPPPQRPGGSGRLMTRASGKRACGEVGERGIRYGEVFTHQRGSDHGH